VLTVDGGGGGGDIGMGTALLEEFATTFWAASGEDAATQIATVTRQR
jgi:hypothetical protein